MCFRLNRSAKWPAGRERQRPRTAMTRPTSPSAVAEWVAHIAPFHRHGEHQTSVIESRLPAVNRLKSPNGRLRMDHGPRFPDWQREQLGVGFPVVDGGWDRLAGASSSALGRIRAGDLVGSRAPQPMHRDLGRSQFNRRALPAIGRHQLTSWHRDSATRPGSGRPEKFASAVRIFLPFDKSDA